MDEKEKGEIGRAKEKIEAFCKKHGLLVKRCKEQVIQDRRQSIFLSMQNDRTASIAGKDIKTHKLEMSNSNEKKLRSDLHKQKK